MKVLKHLTATATDEVYTEPLIHHHTVGFDLGDGAFRSLRLGPKGLVLTDGKAEVAIPAEELARLAEPHLKSQRQN